MEAETSAMILFPWFC